MIYYYVSDMDKAIKFYTEVLGLPLKVRFENHWAEVDAGPITIGLHPAEGKPKKGGGTISLNVKDIEGFVNEIKSKGAKVGKIQSPERGRFVMISDPDRTVIDNASLTPDSMRWRNAQAKHPGLPARPQEPRQRPRPGEVDRRGSLRRQASRVPQSDSPSRSARSSPIDLADQVLDAGLVVEPVE